MKVICQPRQSGKTTKLIEMCAQSKWCYIVVANRTRAKYVADLAKKMNVTIPFPITLDEGLNDGFKGTFIESILIDDADDLLQSLFYRVEVKAISVTDSESYFNGVSND